MRQPSISWLGSTGFLRARSSYYERMLNLFGKDIVAYWPLWDLAGAITAEDISGHGYHGTPSDVTFGAVGIGDGRTSAQFIVASTSKIVVTAAAGGFNGAEGTAMIFTKIDSAALTDGAERYIFFIRVDGNNYVLLEKLNVNNQLRAIYSAGGTGKSRTVTSFTDTNFFNFAITWSNAADRVQVYISGAPYGAAFNALGTWVGTPALMQLSGWNVSSIHSGYSAHAILLNRAATGAEITQAASI